MARPAAAMKLKDRLAANEPEATPPTNSASPKHLPLQPETLAREGGPGTASGSVAEFTGKASRNGKKATVGHFSEAMSRKLNSLAAEEGRTLQSMMGEAWDMLLEKYGRPPFGER